MRLAAAALLAAAVSTASAAPARVDGFNFPCWWHDCYSSPAAAESLARLAGTGARWAAFTPTWYVRERGASRIERMDGTPDDEGLRAGIRRAEALGLSVALKPHVDVVGGKIRAVISPRDQERWWADYRAMILGYAKLASEEKVGLFVVGTELALMAAPAQRERWRALIADVREVYAGPLTYAANGYDFPMVSFWGDLDYIGIDGYFPVPGGTREGVLRAGLSAYVPLVRSVSLAAGKPVLFTEFGIASQKGATIRPWDFGHFGEADPAVQTAYLEAFLAVFGTKSWCAGALNWAWEIDPHAGGPGDGAMTVQNKPAQALLERWFKRDQAPAAPPRVDPAKVSLRVAGLADSVPAGW